MNSDTVKEKGQMPHYISNKKFIVVYVQFITSNIILHNFIDPLKPYKNYDLGVAHHGFMFKPNIVKNHPTVL